MMASMDKLYGYVYHEWDDSIGGWMRVGLMMASMELEGSFWGPQLSP